MDKVTVEVVHPRLMLGSKKVPVGMVTVDQKVALHWVKKGFAKSPEELMPVDIEEGGAAETAELDPAKLEVATPEKKRGRPAKAE